MSSISTPPAVRLAGDPAAPAPMAPVQRAGFVALIGRPNVGKSTLLNQILGEKLAIVSPKPQTTRDRLLGIKNLPGAQLALVDTPGLHRLDQRGRTLLNRFMVEEALAAVSAVDAVVLVLDPAVGRTAGGDAAAGVGTLLSDDDRFMAQQLGSLSKPVLLAVNKIDLLPDKQLLLPLIGEWSKLHNFAAIVPLCACSGDGVDDLLEALCAALPASEPLFPADMLTDRAERWLVAELIREQVFLATRQELPYAAAVTIDQWQERLVEHGAQRGQRRAVVIDATLHVEKASQKKIVVGEGGHMIRDIGTRARGEIARLLGAAVHLSLFVRVDAAWTASAAGLRKMGYDPRDARSLGLAPAGHGRHGRAPRGAASRPRPARAAAPAEVNLDADHHAK